MGVIHKLGPTAAAAARRARLLDEAAELVVATDPEGEIVFASERTMDALVRARVVGTKVAELFHEEDRPAAQRFFEAAGIEGESRAELRVPQPAGEPRWFSLTAFALREGSTLLGVDVVGHDVTEQRWLLESLERRNEELRAFLDSTSKIALLRDPTELARAVVDTALELVTRAACAKIWLTNDEGDLILAAARGRIDGPLAVPFAAVQSLTRPTPLVVERGGARLSSTGTGAAIYVGLMAADRPIGCLAVEARQAVELDLADVAILQAFGGHVSSSLARASAHYVERRLATERAAMLDHIAEGLLVVDSAGRIERMNPAAEVILDVDRERWVRRSFRELVQRVEREDGTPLLDEERPLQRALSGGETVRNMRAAIRRVGEPRILSISAAPIRDHQNEIRGAIAVFRDVTAESKREGQIQRYAQALAQFADAVAMVDRTGTVVDWLGDAAARLGWKPSDVVGQRFGELLTGPNADEARAALDEAVKEDKRLEREVRIWTAAGMTRTCVLTCSPVHADDGRSLGLVLVAKDVTEDRLLRDRLSRSQRLESLGRLAAGVAHEINNPLAFLTVNFEMLDRAIAKAGASGPIAAELAEVLPDLQEGARRIRDVVKSLSAFSEGDARSEVVAIADIVEEALGIVHNELRHKAEVVREIVPVPPVRGSARRLQQAILNVLVNASESIPTGDVANNRVRIVVRPDSDWVVVQIEDTGLGIAAEHLPRVFDPFFTTKRVGAGSGLGLTVAHDIVTTLGGRIDVASEPGTGTSVTIRLPVAEHSTPVPPVPNGSKRLRVLLVDDEAQLRKSYCRALSDDFDVAEAASATAAIEVLERDRDFDVILCDLHMPGKSGAALYREASLRWPSLEPTFLFITGGAFTEETKDLVERITERCLEKPVETPMLVERILSIAKR